MDEFFECQKEIMLWPLLMPCDSNFIVPDNHLEKGDCITFLSIPTKTYRNYKKKKKIILSERRQRKESTHCILHLYTILENVN